MKITSNFNWIDLGVVVCFLRIGYIAANKGFISEFFKDIGILLSLFLSFQFYPSLSRLLANISLFKTNSDLSSFVSFLILLTGVYIIFRYLRGIILALFKVESHYLIEKWVSLILGLSRAAVFVSLVFFSFWLININYFNKSMEKSFSFGFFSPVAPYLYGSMHKVYVKFSPTSSLNKQVIAFGNKKKKSKAEKKDKLRKSSKSS